MTWNEQDVPDQTGRTVLITGANSGLGLRSAQVLAGKGARVLMACRSPERGAAALETVRAEGGEGRTGPARPRGPGVGARGRRRGARAHR